MCRWWCVCWWWCVVLECHMTSLLLSTHKSHVDDACVMRRSKKSKRKIIETHTYWERPKQREREREWEREWERERYREREMGGGGREKRGSGSARKLLSDVIFWRWTHFLEVTTDITNTELSPQHVYCFSILSLFFSLREH